MFFRSIFIVHFVVINEDISKIDPICTFMGLLNQYSWIHIHYSFVYDTMQNRSLIEILANLNQQSRRFIQFYHLLRYTVNYVQHLAFPYLVRIAIRVIFVTPFVELYLPDSWNSQNGDVWIESYRKWWDAVPSQHLEVVNNVEISFDIGGLSDLNSMFL